MKFKKQKRLVRHLLSIPFIWIVLIPLVFLDIVMEIYHRICFPLYGINNVKRQNYISMDRQQLSYLSFIEKLNCAYCGYANGLMAYGGEIAGRTEKYWCGIKHEKKPGFHQPKHHKDFLEYGNEEAYKKI